MPSQDEAARLMAGRVAEKMGWLLKSATPMSDPHDEDWTVDEAHVSASRLSRTRLWVECPLIKLHTRS